VVVLRDAILINSQAASVEDWFALAILIAERSFYVSPSQTAQRKRFECERMITCPTVAPSRLSPDCRKRTVSSSCHRIVDYDRDLIEIRLSLQRGKEKTPARACCGRGTLAFLKQGPGTSSWLSGTSAYDEHDVVAARSPRVLTELTLPRRKPALKRCR